MFVYVLCTSKDEMCFSSNEMAHVQQLSDEEFGAKAAWPRGG